MQKNNDLHLGPQPEDFIWAGGIEDTFIPQTKTGLRALDEYELMGHYEHWRQDLALAREVGLGALRWGVPWYRVEPTRGEFDWRWTDEVLPYLVEELGVTPIIDLMHYGCPFWLKREFDNDDYPQLVTAYATAFAERYNHLVHWYTPLNEALINALWCGKRGLWPPYLRGDRGFNRVMLQVVRGIIRTVNALKAIDPNSTMVHVEAAGLRRTAREDLYALATEDQHRGYLSYDLLTGRVTPEHPLFTWLIRNGAHPDELAAIARAKIPLDVIGLNFYPQWSTRLLHFDSKGRLASRVVEKDGAGFKSMIEDYYERYRVPIMVTETSAFGKAEVRARWLDASVAAVKQLRAEGIPIHGYTWFPIFTMIKWSYRTGQQPLEKYRFELGLYKLDGSEGRTRWQRTPLIEQLQSLIHNPSQAVGTLNVAKVPA